VTLSIVARAADAHMLGMAIASSSPAVAARCAHARAGVGVVATQNITDPMLGPQVLDALARGASANSALQDVLATTRFAAYRQLLVLGRDGAPALHTGARSLGIAAGALGKHAAAAGNLLARAEVAGAMIAAFEAGSGHLGARLLQALRAGAACGGEAGPIHSAGLLIVRDVAWPIVDLRVDWSDADPVAALSAIWDIYAPQIDDYVQRALDPTHAPAFGVAGNV
jgi:uncharacterized Ntn-hydrolase superfamily protein